MQEALDNCPSEAQAPLPDRLKPPVLPALRVTTETGEAVHIAAWCPWCETVHWHGAAGGGGNRAPHCFEDRTSPFQQTGYSLDIVADSYSEEAIAPLGLMVGKRRLHHVLDGVAEAIRALALRAVLDMKSVRSPVIQKRNDHGKTWLFGSGRWLIEPRFRRPIEGSGLLRLAAALYGVSPGIVAVRLLETVSFERLDARAVFELQQIVERWIARGAPNRLGR